MGFGKGGVTVALTVWNSTDGHKREKRAGLFSRFARAASCVSAWTFFAQVRGFGVGPWISLWAVVLAKRIMFCICSVKFVRLSVVRRFSILQMTRPSRWFPVQRVRL